jgi:hypothetical protein
MGFWPLTGWDCGSECRCDRWMSVVSVLCYQVEASAAGLPLVWRSFTECGVSECDLETSDHSGCRAMTNSCILSCSLWYYPAVCDIILQFVILSCSLCYYPAVCDIILQFVVLSCCLWHYPAVCDIILQFVILSCSLCRMSPPSCLNASLTSPRPACSCVCSSDTSVNSLKGQANIWP